MCVRCVMFVIYEGFPTDGAPHGEIACKGWLEFSL